jgi:hypothetical protein
MSNIQIFDEPVSYKGVRITPQPSELHEGGWNADFTLDKANGDHDDDTLFCGKNTYPSREDAVRAAFDSARRVIDKSW